MMKEYSIVLAALAVCLFSCAKESIDEKPVFKMEEMTFSVNDNEATKTVLTGKVVNWQDNDKVSVFDNVQNAVLGPYTILNNAVKALVTEGSTAFYALYPYDGHATISGSVIKTVIPQYQLATVDSFDPAANVSVAYSTRENGGFLFKNVGTLVSFTVDDENVEKVILMGNNNEKIAGESSIDYNGGSPSVTASHISVTMHGSFVKGNTYYFVIAPVSFANGITLTLIKSDGTFATKCTSAAVAFARNKVINLGTLKDKTTDYGTDLYAAFNSGATIEIAGKAYNKKDFGASEIVTLDSATNTDIYDGIGGWNKRRIAFLSGDAAFTFHGSNRWAIKQETVLISRNPANPVTVSCGTKYSNLRGGSLVMKNINLDCTALTENYVFNNAISTGANPDPDVDFDNLHFDGCTITTNKSLYYRTRLDNGIASVRFVGCTIKIPSSTAINIISPSESICLDVYKDIVFQDNVFYAVSLCNAHIFNYNNTAVQTHAGEASAWNCSMMVKNNVFYNVTSTNALFRQYQLASLEVGGNIYYSPSSTASSKTYYLFSENQSNDVVTNTGDVVYGLTGDAKWSYAGNSYGRPAGITNKLDNEAVNPIVSFNSSTGAYTLAAGYEGYGPQNR
ncbi:MAG: hypothetical protein IK119_09265 [Bacteroidales bacterium]|nr:hypothetical protein [Bacteroidales bacterium]